MTRSKSFLLASAASPKGIEQGNNKLVIIIADAETDAKDGDDKSDDNNDLPGTSLERKKKEKKRPEQNNSKTTEEKAREGRKQQTDLSVKNCHF